MAFTMDQIASGVRNALYGREVREWLALLAERCVELVSKMEEAVENATAAAEAAKKSEDNAASSASSAKDSADAAAESAANAKISEDSAAKSAEQASGIIDRMSDIEGGYFLASNLTIPKDAWSKTSEWSLYPYIAELPDKVVTEVLEPQVIIQPVSTTIARDAGMASICETGDHVIRFWAASKPTEDIKTRLLLFGIEGEDGATLEALLEDTLGLSVQDGKIHVNYVKES